MVKRQISIPRPLNYVSLSSPVKLPVFKGERKLVIPDFGNYQMIAD
jgi:hypothetical protein